MRQPTPTTDAELLRAWSGERCEESFRTLVTKYLGLVENVAMRRTGDAALVKDVAQIVFTRLASNEGVKGHVQHTTRAEYQR